MAKKLLVLSDSHGNSDSLKNIFLWAKEFLPPQNTLCATAFCGDGLADLQSAANAAGFYSDWFLVSGNNDYDYSIPSSKIFDFEGHRFFLCHGHKHNLYTGYHNLVTAAHSNGASVVLFGHAHIPVKNTEKGILLINPGSTSRPRSFHGASFAVIECSDKIDVKFYGISTHGIISSIKL